MGGFNDLVVSLQCNNCHFISVPMGNLRISFVFGLHLINLIKSEMVGGLGILDADIVVVLHLGSGILILFDVDRFDIIWFSLSAVGKL